MCIVENGTYFEIWKQVNSQRSSALIECLGKLEFNVTCLSAIASCSQIAFCFKWRAVESLIQSVVGYILVSQYFDQKFVLAVEYCR